MLYNLLKLPAKIASWFYIRRLPISHKELLEINGPVLIAANHPNSFLDAIIVDTFFKNPVHSLTRGDVFKKPFHRKILKQLNMLPIYRVSEGVENMGINYQTFESCKDIFRKNGLVLIFSEGGCINEWKLRPLKKGTARLALSSWEEGIPLRVLPLGINYSSFRRFGKNVELQFGNFISQDDITAEGEGQRIVQFNEILKNELKQIVVELPQENREEIRKRFEIYVPTLKRIFLFLPALLGFILHAPLYFPVKIFTKKLFNDNDHYDSVVVALLFVTYPLYLILLTLFAYIISGSAWSGLLILLIPLMARASVEVKGQMDK